jgi:hypothetical protein
MSPEALIRVYFLTPEEGGRKSHIEGNKYGCPIMYREHGYDCRFVLDDRARFELGKTYDIPVKFLNPKLALRDLSVGIEISLWEGKTIARGRIIEIFSQDNSEQ